jgi:hypothetical protein
MHLVTIGGMTDQEKLEAIREWAVTGIMRRAWPPGDGTAVMLELRRDLLTILGEHAPHSDGGIPQLLPASWEGFARSPEISPAEQIAASRRYISRTYGGD